MAQIFPRWTNDAPRYTLVAVVLLGGFGAFAAYYWMSPYHTDVGYMPTQPVPYSHKRHVGEMGMDCRYCHVYVERTPHAGVPPTETCMNCHRQVKTDSPALEPVRLSWKDGTPIAWRRVHKLPDFAYFDHSAHVGLGVGENRAAVGCETCHGRVDTMDVVKQVQPLSMAWCISCHNDPAPNLRPPEEVTTMGYSPTLAWREKARQISTTLNPPGNYTHAQQVKADGTVATYATAGCTGCHR